MRLLVDESAAISLESELAAAGEEAKHVKTLGLNGSPDLVIFEHALRERYDGIITKDRYADPDAHLAAFRAMRDGLRIIELRFRSNAPGTGGEDAQAELVISQLDRSGGRSIPIPKSAISCSTGARGRSLEGSTLKT